MDALFSCFKEAIGVLRKRKAWLISFGAAILTGVVLGLVLPKPASVRQYYLTYCRAYTDGIFVSSVFRLFFRRLISVVLLLLLIVPLYSGGVSAGVFQRIYVRHRYRDSSFYVRNRRFLYFFNLRFADGSFNVCAACDCLHARRRNMQKTSARVRKRRNFLFFFIASRRRDGLRACRNIACNNHFSPRKQNFLKISYNFFSDSGN